MKSLLLILSMVLISLKPANAQIIILQENFGSSQFDGNPAAYPDYTSDAQFSGDDSHFFPVPGSSGYAEASGGVAVQMGTWATSIENTVFTMLCNTEGYFSVRLSFGFKHNSGGWGTCTLTNNFTKIEYSTDGSTWSVIDKAALMNGSSWPCADANIWAYVELAEILPSSPTLYIRFTHTSPTTHPFYLDDITITAFTPDNTPPSTPSNLSSANVDFNSCILIWDESSDDNALSHYRVFKDGNYLLSTTSPMAEVKYQIPGSSANFSVIAVDVSENESPESEILPVVFSTKPVDHKYSWETPHAKVLPTGDIEWQPEGYEFVAGSAVRYIDYENGMDTNDGLSVSTPWKHHPWDNNATGIAAGSTGVHTYIFKRGVVYRGNLTAKASGYILEPVRLTSDPSWGTGEAYFFGSQRITSGWTKADASSAPNVPNPENVWYTDISLPATKLICEIEGDTYKQLHVARSPNYQYTPDDPIKTWWKMSGKVAGDGGLWLTDNTNLTNNDPDFYKGATVFSQEDMIVMCTVWKQDVSEWDPANNRIKVPDVNFGGIGSHYFIENTPFLLDAPGEFYYNTTTQRLYVRLEGDKDPNTTIIEAATTTELIKIDSKHDIEISGLTFGMTTAHSVRYGEEDARSTIRMTGICNNINIKNNKFLYVNGGISLNNTGSALVNTHSITVSDNDFQNVGDLSIIFATNSAYMDNINILRNNIYNTGYRHQGRWYSSIPAIYAQLNYGEVAGNIIDVSWGNGIDMFWGKGGGSNDYIPFIRGMIHHNKASNTLIGNNDYGGIESWQGGPAYCYNNFSHNASGYKHYNNSSIGYAFYFDGAFKHIVFNNIASGVSHNRNSAGIMQVLGFYNMYVHNTGYNMKTFLNAWKGALGLSGYNTYLSNLSEDIETFFRHELDPAFIPFESYGYNVTSGTPFKSSLEYLSTNLSLSQFQNKLISYNSQLTQTGWNATDEVIPNAASHDFRPADNSSAVERGVKFFTAFPLARVVGEWNFYIHPADSSIIMADNFYMTEDFSNRETYKDVPKNHLKAYNVSADKFIIGDLEDWTKGALTFDGSTIYCQIDHAAASAVKSNNVDMTDNSFIIEVYLKTTEGHTGGAIVSKFNGAGGYELEVEASGSVKMTLYESGSAVVSRSGLKVVNDTLWHHILAEVNRNAGIDIYIDGELSNGTLSGIMPDIGVSLSGTADMLVGKDSDDNYFSGAIDFLRISKGSLFDACTTVDELYKWQSDGPFLYDMKGVAPSGKRDAGALEINNSCNLTLSQTSILSDETGSLVKLFVTTSDEFVIRDKAGDFFTVNISEDTIEVTVAPNPGLNSLQGSFNVIGCNKSLIVSVSQSGSPCSFICDVDVLELTHHEQLSTIEIITNGGITVSSNMSFVTASVNNNSVNINITENPSAAERVAEVEIVSCDGIHTINVVQEGLVGIKNQFGNGGMEIYPNPVSGNDFNIVLPENIGRSEYVITDLSGRIVQNGQLLRNMESIQLDVESGTYIIKVSGKDRHFEGIVVVL